MNLVLVDGAIRLYCNCGLRVLAGCVLLFRPDCEFPWTFQSSLGGQFADTSDAQPEISDADMESQAEETGMFIWEPIPPTYSVKLTIAQGSTITAHSGSNET